MQKGNHTLNTTGGPQATDPGTLVTQHDVRMEVARVAHEAVPTADDETGSDFSVDNMLSDEEDEDNGQRFAQWLIDKHAVHNRHNLVALLANAKICTNFPGATAPHELPA